MSDARRAAPVSTRDDLDLRVAKTRLLGGATVDASFDAWRWETMLLEGLHAKVHVAQGSISEQDDPTKHLVDVKAVEIGIDAPEVDLDDPMRAFQAKVDMPDTEIASRGLLQKFQSGGKDMKVAQGHARFDAHCAIDVKDHLGAGTFDLHSKRLGLTVDDLDLLADLTAHVRVHDWSLEHGDLALDDARVEVTKLSSTKRGAGQPAATIASLVVTAKTDRFALSDPFQHIEIGGNVRGGRLEDPTALDAFLSKASKVHFDAAQDGASFDADLHARIDGRVAQGKIAARGHGIGIRGTKMRVLGDLDASADVTEWRIDESKVRVSRSRIVADDVVAHLGSSSGPDVYTRHMQLTAKIDQLDFAHPSLRGVDYRLIVDDARIDDATHLNALLASPGASSAPELVVESGKARGSVDVTVLASQRTATGGVRIVVDDAGVRYQETHLSGDVALAVRVKGFDRDRDLLDFSGSTITLRNVRATGAKADSTAWNGEVALVNGALRVSEAPAFDGFVQVHADEAKPIWGLALRSTLPKFLVGLMRASTLSGQSRIVAGTRADRAPRCARPWRQRRGARRLCRSRRPRARRVRGGEGRPLGGREARRGRHLGALLRAPALARRGEASCDGAVRRGRCEGEGEGGGGGGGGGEGESGRAGARGGGRDPLPQVVSLRPPSPCRGAPRGLCHSRCAPLVFLSCSSSVSEASPAA